MHAEFRDSEPDESDERKHRKGFFRAGFFLILYVTEYKSHGKNPIHRQACAKTQRRRYNERSCIPAAALRDEEILALAGGSGTSRGTGGMITKLHAGEIATSAGIDTVVMNGSDPEDIYKLLDGRQIGTHFKAQR